VTRRSRSSARGWAILAWGIGVFVGVQIVTSLLFDYRWFRVRYPNYPELVAKFDQTTPAPNVIFLGSSRSRCLINPAEIDQVVRDVTGDPNVHCFDASIGWGDPVVCERVLRDLIDRGALPRYVVVECCPEGVNHRNGWLNGYTAWLLCWHDFPAYCRELLVTDNMMRFLGSHLLPLYSYRDPIRQRLRIEAKSWYAERFESGAAPVHPNAPTMAAAAPKSAMQWQQAIADRLRQAQSEPPHETTPPPVMPRWFRDYRPGGNSACRLERLLAECRANGIEPILVGVPLSRAHRSYYTPEIEAAFQAYLAEVTRKYGCRYVDYRDRLPDACFCDHHHVTTSGRVVFCRMFALEVLAPRWRDAH
jgi:hypothetical protein